MAVEWVATREWPTIVLDRLGDTGVARITFNRPERRNAINLQLVDDFTSALEQVRADPAVRVVVTRGNGPSYSSGLDLYALREYAAAPPGDWDRPHPAIHLYEVVRNFARITIAQVHGCCTQP